MFEGNIGVAITRGASAPSWFGFGLVLRIGIEHSMPDGSESLPLIVREAEGLGAFWPSPRSS